jgi:hypothetical protein
VLKKLLAALLATVFVFSFVACSDDGGDEETTTTDEETTESTDEESTESTDEESTESTDEESTDATDEEATDDTTGLDDLDNLGDCLEVSLTYAGLFLSLLPGAEVDSAEIEQSLDEIRGSVPEDVQDDLDVIADGLADADSYEDVSDFLDSDEFTEADANINAYFEEECG